MKFELLIDGKSYNVEIDIGEVITIEVEGKTFKAKTKKNDNGMSVGIGKKEFLVRFEESHISIDGRKHNIEVRNLRRGRPSWYNKTDESEDVKVGKPVHKVPGGEGIIHPPMPGRVISIKVKKGDSVKTGSPIIVLEAMKMQNEIISNINGVVREIRVSEGDLVESGDVLVIIGN
ncbi:MAG: biotin/lipoyl-binding protein [Thermoplasmatales archaeon]|nr:MAG: biotin/lipoyl-binding protein [Thermoplasmatales archaeon]